MKDQIIAAAVITLVLAGAAFLIAHRSRAQPKREPMPMSEYLVFLLLRFAAWMERTATAMDAAIVRYRMERRTLSIHLESTRARLAEFGGSEA